MPHQEALGLDDVRMRAREHLARRPIQFPHRGLRGGESPRAGAVGADVSLQQLFPAKRLRGRDDVADDGAAVLVQAIAEGGQGGDVVVHDVGEGDAGDYGGARGADGGGGGAEGGEQAVPAGLDARTVLADEVAFQLCEARG